MSMGPISYNVPCSSFRRQIMSNFRSIGPSVYHSTTQNLRHRVDGECDNHTVRPRIPETKRNYHHSLYMSIFWLIFSWYFAKIPLWRGCRFGIISKYRLIVKKNRLSESTKVIRNGRVLFRLASFNSIEHSLGSTDNLFPGNCDEVCRHDTCSELGWMGWGFFRFLCWLLSWLAPGKMTMIKGTLWYLGYYGAAQLCD